MENIRKRFLKIHGTALVLMGAVFAAATMVGRFKGIGPSEFLHENQIAAIGFFEAYLLAAVCGIFLWVGSFQTNVQNWNRMGAVIHIPLVISNIIFWKFYSVVGLEMAGTISTTAHFILIAVESFFGFSKK